MNRIVTLLSVLSLTTMIGAGALAQTKTPRTAPVGTAPVGTLPAETLPAETIPAETMPDDVTIASRETRREDAGGCVGSINYNYAMTGSGKESLFGERYQCNVADENDTSKCATFPFKTRISIHMYGPGQCVNYVDILEDDPSQGARLSINGLFYDTDATAATLAAPFLEAVRTRTQMMAFVTRGEGRNNNATTGNIYTKSCASYYDGTFRIEGALVRCKTGYEKSLDK